MGYSPGLIASSMLPLILKRASTSRPSGQWREDDYDVLENGGVVGRIFHLEAAAPEGRPWMWASGHITATSGAGRTAMTQHARLRWQHSPRAGGGSEG